MSFLFFKPRGFYFFCFFYFFIFFFLQKDIEKGCNYRSWIDGEMCGRSKQIIPGLLRKIHHYEGEIESLKQLIQKQEVELENFKKVLEEKEHYMELLVEELELKCTPLRSCLVLFF